MVAAGLVGGLAVFLVPAHATPVRAATVPSFDHVFVVVMENKSYGAIIGSSAAPYINSLRQAGGLATSYYAVSHPSLPNYLALTGGSTYGITSDCTTCWVAASNIADNLEANGKTWKAYEESMPSPCFVGDSYPYVQKHDPFIYFNNIRTNATRCQSHVVPYSQLATDLSATSTTPAYSFITPNMCNDMHDCSVATGDSWLGQQVPKILASPAFTTQRSLLAVVWDEDDSSGANQVPLILIGSGITANLQSATGYNHYSLLKTIEVALGLPALTGSDSGAAPMDGFFGLVGWTSVGGVATSKPTASSSTSGSLDVFVRGTDNALWHRRSSGGVWSAWESLGGVVSSNPSAVSQGANNVDVFVRGTDNAVWHRSWNGTAWAAWDSLGGTATSSPTTASWGAGRLDMVVRGTDNALWHRSWNGAAWSSWDSAGGTATSDPGMVASTSGRVDVFVRGTDDAIWHRSGPGNGTWSAWDSLGGVLTSGPASSSCGGGHLDVFVTGTDGGIWQRGFNGVGWGTWSPLHGSWTMGPAAVCPSGTTSVELFERAPDMAVVRSTTPGS